VNLIDELGGYEKVSKAVKKIDIRSDRYKRLKAALLEYRRQHNIFEESDKIVFIDDFMHGELMTVAWTRKGEVWMDEGAKRCTDLSMIRHATDAEIKTGKRLEVNQ
jgi:hypothetical protein